MKILLKEKPSVLNFFHEIKFSDTPMVENHSWDIHDVIITILCVIFMLVKCTHLLQKENVTLNESIFIVRFKHCILVESN